MNESLILEMLKKIDSKVDNIDSKVNDLDSKVNNLDSKVNNLSSDVNILTEKVDNLQKEMTQVRVVTLENNVIPRLETIEECYLTTYKRYVKELDKIENLELDVNVMKRAIRNIS